MKPKNLTEAEKVRLLINMLKPLAEMAALENFVASHPKILMGYKPRK